MCIFCNLICERETNEQIILVREWQERENETRGNNIS